MTERAYLITFRTYGTWLHGDARGSVDRRQHSPGEPLIERDDGLLRRRRNALVQSPVILHSGQMRDAVEAAIRETSRVRGWPLLALNVRTNHVHLVVVLGGPPEPAMTTFKAWATRRLREAGLVDGDARVWSTHGSTRYLDTEASVEAAVNYVLFEQGTTLGGEDGHAEA